MLACLGALAGCSDGEGQPAPDGGVTRIVYAVRQHTVLEGDTAFVDVAGGMGQVMDYGRYVPGARLEILDLRSGDVTNLIADYPEADLNSLDVSYDATRVVFSMKRDATDTYHLYWASLEPDADGTYDVTPLTMGPQDDQHPIWLPGDRIAFATNQAYTEMGTRADEYNHARVVTQIATITMGGVGADRKLCSQNLSHTINLFPMSDGRVGFSRWEHLENVNDVKLFAMNPDCTQMVAIAGQHSKPSNSLVQVSEANEPYLFYAVATSREDTIQAGALVRIDARGDNGVDEELVEYEVLTPAVPRAEDPSPVGRYRNPQVLPDGKLLVTWSGHDVVNEINELSLTPPDYGIYIYDPVTRANQLVVNYEDTWELYAKPVVARTEPEIISSIQNTADSSLPVLLGSVDIRQTSLGELHGETVTGAQFDGTSIDEALGEAVKVRIIEGFSSEAAGETMFGLTMAEGAALLGEAIINSDGSWSAEIPPYVPVHLQAVDEFELAIRNQTTWIQGMPGEDRACGGCHERRTEGFSPSEQALSIAAGKAPQDFLIPVLDRTEYPWAYADDAANQNQVQALLNQKCVGCHNETTNGSVAQQFYTVTMTEDGQETTYEIPWLDLSDRSITVSYDNEIRDWPASYVSIFYPAALEMEVGDGAEVEGEVPPMWGIPSDARNSVLIEKLNVTSALDASRYAWELGQGFTDARVQGGTRTDHAAFAELTREEVTMLIRVIDMGGQFYARQNTGFQPFTDDPLSGAEY
ncbi:MAG TPA: hypothetical protein VF989_13325 [Polyangiaceae bacterium]